MLKHINLRIRLLALAALFAMVGCSVQPGAKWPTMDGKPPVVIAHRGDSGAYPEHTLAAYRSALEKGADYLEPDIVLTRDGVPVCRHDLELKQTTDIAKHPEFADRKGKGWPVTSFNVAELKRLRAVQHVQGRDRSMDGRFAVPTLAELIDLVHEHNQTHGTTVGLLIEIKAPAQHRAAGLDVSRASFDIVKDKAKVGKSLPIIFQCFDRDACERIAGWGGYRVDWLTSKAFEFDGLPEGIGGLGVNKSLIKLTNGRSPLIDAAHARGLQVHAWTFRDDRLPKDIDWAHPKDEMLPYLRAGLDGVITDFPETGAAARHAVAEVLERNAKNSSPLSERIRKQSPRRYLNR